jgi:pimeloyl-ACP methyl ester carboxylesterase
VKRKILLSVVVVLAILPVFSAFGHSATATGPKPTIVLVHGAFADGSSWSRVVRVLQDEGYTVFVPPNPLRGLASDSAYIASFLQTISGPIVLVGHSYGGAVISNAATGNTNVKALVYVDAFVPDQGETLTGLSSVPPPAGQPASCLANPTAVFNFVPFNGGVDVYIKQTVYPSCFANTIPVAQANVLAAEQRPISSSAFNEQSGVPAWKTIHSWYVVGTLDLVIPPWAQLFMAHRANATITQVAGPHPSMITQPDAVADVIQQAAGQSPNHESNNQNELLL